MFCFDFILAATAKETARRCNSTPMPPHRQPPREGRFFSSRGFMARDNGNLTDRGNRRLVGRRMQSAVFGRLIKI